MASIFQTILLGHPRRANWVLANFPEGFWFRIGRRKAIASYNLANKKVPAFKHFLSKDKSPKQRFCNAPLTDKNNYIQTYPFNERITSSSFSKIHSYTKSSGSSGKPTYWPRFGETDVATSKAFNFIFEYLYQIYETPTLYINNLALGTWTGGEVMGDGARRVACFPNSKLAVISPGQNCEETVDIISTLKDFYTQIIFASYPPFAKQLLNRLEEQKVDIAKTRLRFLTGGECFSESYRDYLNSKLGSKELNNIIGLYASADAGVFGSETPLSILIKREAIRKPQLAKELFGREHIDLMSLVQFNPVSRYVEAMAGEIVTTVQQAAPLIRFNTHDEGGVIKFSTVLETCARQKYYPYQEVILEGFKKPWKLPFLYVFGRTDNVISIGGANIYPENVQYALRTCGQINSFKICSRMDENQNTRFEIAIEANHNESVGELKNEESQLTKVLIEGISRTNEDYKDALRLDPESLTPKLEFFAFNEGPFRRDKDIIKSTFLQSDHGPSSLRPPEE